MTRFLPAAAALLVAGMASPAFAEPAVVQFHADWCGKCKQLAPKLAAAAPAMDAAGVELTELDFTPRTDDNTAAQRVVAEGVGAAAIFDEYAPSTGFAVLYDDETGAVLGKIKADMSVEDITKMVTDAGA